MGAAPVVVGVKVSAIVQVPPAAATVGVRQVDDGSTAYGEPAEIARELTVRVAVAWLLVSVTILMGLVWPWTANPKATVLAESEAGLIPVPETATNCGVLLALVEMDTEPAGAAPSADGVNVTPMVQVAPAARLPELGQVVDGSMA